MLVLKNIKKDYPAGDGVVHALRGVSLRFRKSEFVSILGPSGCGKTTILNIIGGLDQYTDGDLVINGCSTKDFRDRDWDTYRNHSIGFVFQSYNLIPHQTVLQNVELALTLSGVSKAERRTRAQQALEQVGLGTQLNKKPSEMSGGQMQRVAIARALVNNPDIILADEPTGALDTETSVQVMEILKDISKDRLIIMVTHNPDLAEKYSTRIIRVLDGNIIDDSNPMTEEEHTEAVQKKRTAEAKNGKMPSMSVFTSFGLSLKNLFTKKSRTMLTSFAGSIGIIGIALIYAVSVGMTAYIDTVQEDTLSSYPLTIEETHVDIGTLMQSFLGSAKSGHNHENDAVYVKSVIYDMIDALNNMETTENDLGAFKTYIEAAYADETNALHEALSGIRYTYDIEPLIYTENTDGTIVRSDTQTLMNELAAQVFGMSMDASSLSVISENSPMANLMSGSGGMSADLWQELLSGDNGSYINPLLEKQYDLVYGAWPNSYDEIVLVLDENNELDDLTLYALGLKTKDDIDAIMDAAINHTELKPDTQKWSYETICQMEFRAVLAADCYSYDEKTGLYSDLRESDAGLKYLYDNAMTLHVSGIIRPSEDAVAPMLSGSIGYTSALTAHIIEQSRNSSAITAQQNQPSVDIFTGLPFRDSAQNMSDAEKEQEFRAYIEVMDEAGKSDAYRAIMRIPSDQMLDASVEQIMGSMTREEMENNLTTAMTVQLGMSENDIQTYISSMSEDDITDLFRQMVVEQVRAQYAAQVETQLSGMSDAERAAALMLALDAYTTEQCAAYYDEILIFSESDYKTNLSLLGCVDIDKPASVNLYASTFENKDIIEDAIAAYNADLDELDQIRYTDYVGLMMSSVTTIINAITYILIAFVAISLIVSSIMIGVITLISVQERTKEIGILRAIGASKRDVSGLFNAETVIIGFTSGLLGVLITALLCIPINAILYHLTGIGGLRAFLPVSTALILIGISVILTLFAGIIPSRSAAKKDPVVALRSE